eukprot:Selendium_serpulae@DN4218_c0_g1_i1.p1
MPFFNLFNIFGSAKAPGETRRTLCDPGNAPTTLPASRTETCVPELVSAAPSSSSPTAAVDSQPTIQPGKDLLTPIQYDLYSREFQNVMAQDNFDGFHMEANKSVTPQLQASHALFLGTTLRPSGYIYQFGPTYQSENGNLVLLGRWDAEGIVNGRLIKRFASDASNISSMARMNESPAPSEFKVNFVSSLLEKQRNLCEFTYDSAGSDWASSMKASWQGAWFLSGAFSQVIAPRLQLGGELSWISAQGATTGSIGARYAHKDNFLSAQLSRGPDFSSETSILDQTHGAKVQFVRKVNDRLSLASELNVNTDMESALKMGYDYTFRQARVQGAVDTSGKVNVYCQDATGFGVSGMIDFWKGDYKFGFLMRVVPPPPDAPVPESHQTK